MAETAGLTLRDILKLVDTLVKNNVDTKIKIMWINQIMNQAYRDYPTLQAIQPLSIKAGQEFYALLADCPEDRVSSVWIEGNGTYPYIPVDVQMEEGIGQCCTIVNSVALLIYPTPLRNASGFLYYKPRPVQMTIADLGTKPNFPVDFHEMLVSGCAARVAKSSTETLALVSLHENDFQRMAEKADLVITKRRQKSVINSRSWT